MKDLANAASVFIWGLVLAKANQGIHASNTSNPKTVASKLSSAGGLFCMLICAGFLKLYAEVDSFRALEAAPETVHKALKAPKLEAGKPESFYDSSSSHYMGGAHNVALAKLQGSLPEASKKLSSGKGSVMSHLGNQYKKTTKSQGSQREMMNAKLGELCCFLSFLGTVACGVFYLVTFKTYHSAVDKLDKITAIFNNPNARVAAGTQGKRVLKKLGVMKEAAAKPAPKK